MHCPVAVKSPVRWLVRYPGLDPSWESLDKSVDDGYGIELGRLQIKAKGGELSQEKVRGMRSKILPSASTTQG
jgi:hypothetical protein